MVLINATIAIPTFGSDVWYGKGYKLAKEMTNRFPNVRVSHLHDEDLHQARNNLLAGTQSEWICFLDADDELEPNYFDHMKLGSADVRAPSVRYHTPGMYRTPYVPRVVSCRHDGPCGAECLPLGNWIVIGALARTEVLRAAGGFRDYPCYEDWDLWLRLHLVDITFEAVPQAVYRASLRSGSRNRAGTNEERLEVHRQIARANGVPIP